MPKSNAPWDRVKKTPKLDPTKLPLTLPSVEGDLLQHDCVLLDKVTGPFPVPDSKVTPLPSGKFLVQDDLIKSLVSKKVPDYAPVFYVYRDLTGLWYKVYEVHPNSAPFFTGDLMYLGACMTSNTDKMTLFSQDTVTIHQFNPPTKEEM